MRFAGRSNAKKAPRWLAAPLFSAETDLSP